MVDADGSDPQRGFDLLSDETRVEILRALADRLRERPENPTIGFADLRRRVGVRDSGNFNYHLQQLEGRFVRGTPEGYRIAPAGLLVVTALITGVYGEGTRLGPTDLEDSCPGCDEPFTATYEDGLLVVACPNDHVFRNALPPGAIEDRTLSELVDLLALKSRRDLAFAVERVCPYCYARLEWSATVDPDAELPSIDTGCSRCGVRVEIPVIVSLLRHPTVAAFYYDHGIDVRKRPLWTPEFFTAVDVSTVADSDRLRVEIELEGDRLEATLDESLSVLEVTTHGT
ncbi:winged helix-turn-helix domain-containing protein [Natronococcus sp. A-GB1]|uniref:winged helix-turn-helix domain-containing protein n=1 Tax=Natronococcus sp. A-GB1 TaxID=3037648 RepID=UPI00241D89AE|nr:winged helix-turn-helix domain-containing protein [Natronococcus sp. A-GB1]MDG5758008.1 winged helix-turn-helix domain-containing protein [Natronococcus sp. A-GB1]